MNRIVKNLLLVICLISPLSLFAQTISVTEAQAKAKAFFSNGAKKLPAGKEVKRVAPKVENIELAYTSEKEGKPCFYVFNNGTDDGFVIVGGDEAAHDILAYIPQGHFCYDSIPDNVKWWLGEYEKEISTAKKLAPKLQPQRSANAPKRAAQSNATTDVRDLFTDIPDLITTKWNQTEPYNAAIPEIQHTNGSSIVSPTGCVPTAIAQIMNYWQWPATGVGSYSYTLDYDGLDEWSAGVAEGSFDGLLPATFSADFGNTTYDWANMLDDYTIGNPTQAQIDAVSTLMYHVGVSEYTLYGPGGSGGGIDRMMKALKENFRYSNRLSYLIRGDYLDDEWEEIIYSEIQAGRPVYYEGAMHAFLLHGYSADYKMFSVNWGWGGLMDGYWKITGTTLGYFLNNANYVEDLVGHGICINLEPNNIVHSNTFSNVGDTIVVDGIRYDLIGPLSKTVEVTFAPNGKVIYEGELTIPDSITYNNNVYTVTKIGRFGLASEAGSYYYGIPMRAASAITSVHLPNTLRSIAYGGLNGCSIKDLQLPESVEMLGQKCFMGMPELISVTLPQQLTYIPNNGFYYCNKLESINLPASINALGMSCFASCAVLDLFIVNSLEVPSACVANHLHGTDNLTPFPSTDLSRKVLAVPLAAIEDYRNDTMFGQWGTIIPIDSLPEHFGERFVVNDVEYKFLLSGELSAIGYKGESIDTLIIPSMVSYEGNTYTVTKIGRGDFANAVIKSIVIENGIREIGSYAFFENNSIENIYVPGTVDIIGASAFSWCQRLKTIDIANGVNEIGDNLFERCSRLENFAMPNTVKRIGNAAFYGCFNLRNIKLSSSLKELPYSLLWFTKVNSLVIPTEITRIGNLELCDSLQTIICYASVAPILPDIANPFPSIVNQGVLYVPAESVSAYQSTPGWQDWGTILPIVPIDSILIEDVIIEKTSSDAISIDVYPFNATEGQIFYSSSNPKVATISPNGVITAIETGETIITAETLDGKSTTCTVTVVASPQYNIYNETSTPVVGSADNIAGIPVDFTTYPNAVVYYNANTTKETLPANFIGKDANGEWYADEINLTDAQQLYVPENVEVAKVKYNKTSSNTDWEPFYVPFDVPYSEIEKDFYVARLNAFYQFDDNNDGEIDRDVLEAIIVKNGTLCGNTPYLIKAKTVGSHILELQDATLLKSESNSIDCSTVSTKYVFTGNYEELTSQFLTSCGAYIMQGGTLVKTSGSEILSPFRWYLTIHDRISTSAPNKSRKIMNVRVVGEPSITGIEYINDQSSTNGYEGVYNLDGRKMLNPNKAGIYIINGKKIYRK